jgi:hypothetical protein
MLLVGHGEDHAFRSEEALVAGGRPELIQGEHEPRSALREQPMRSLFQFGDVAETVDLGDCGVGYVRMRCASGTRINPIERTWLSGRKRAWDAKPA